MKLKRILSILAILCVVVTFAANTQRVLKIYSHNEVIGSFPIAVIDSIKIDKSNPSDKLIKIYNSDNISEISVANIDSVKIEEVDTVALALAKEREALIAIYKALDGDNWTNNENWCSDKPVSEWYGVTTNNDKKVFSLYIEGNVSLNSERVIFPKEVKYLKNLTYLSLFSTNVDSFPEEISTLNVQEIYSGNNIFLYLTEFAPLYKTNKLRIFEIVGAYDDKYFMSDSYKYPSPIPDELLNNKDLQSLGLSACNLSGEIPEKLWELTNLRSISLYNNNGIYLYGEISPAIANLHNLKYLSFFNINLKGGLPEEIYNLTQLEGLAIDCCYIGGQLSSNIQNLKKLRNLNLSQCDLEGCLPKELSILMEGELTDCMLSYNKLSGNIPMEIKAHPKWAQMWTSIVSGNQFNLTIDDVPVPEFNTNDVWGNRVVSDEIYKKNKYTIIYGYDVAVFPYISNAVYSCYDMHKLYNAYNKYGVDIVMVNELGWEKQVRDFVEAHDIPWTAICARPFGMTAIPYIVIVDSMGKAVYTTILTNSLFNDVRAFFEERFPNAYYTSTDYSKDGMVTTLQTASVGEGIDIVLMGDAYSDRQIADGTYAKDMEFIYNNLFTEEPYNSFKDYFNVHYVNVVSATESYEYGYTALDGYFGGGTLVGGNDNAVFTYAQKAISAEQMDEALIIVAMNSDNYAGTCYMYHPESSSDYGNGISVSYFPKGGDAETFAALLHHEALGHGFAKLADEYAYEDMGAVPNDYVSQIQSQQTDWGWWKNVDFTSDTSAIRWNYFINDSRYQYDGLGAFEGGLTYWNGVWRPTENSIMRYNTGGFNAPSREAIYHRIHKLAYGDDWQYNYEDFVKYDEINRKTTPASSSVKSIQGIQKEYKPLHAPIVKKMSWREAK